jgi:hypothetical protein
MELAVGLGRKTNPRLNIGICGEHGGDPKSIAFCHRIGLDSVSCSAFRVPVARLAAAHAALEDEHAKPAKTRGGSTIRGNSENGAERRPAPRSRSLVRARAAASR